MTAIKQFKKKCISHVLLNLRTKLYKNVQISMLHVMETILTSLENVNYIPRTCDIRI